MKNAKDLSEYIRNNKPGPFKALPITQDHGKELFVTCYFENEECVATETNSSLTLYRSMDDNRIIGCAIWIRKEDIIPL